MVDIVLLTEAKYINIEAEDWYSQQVITEDNLVKIALEELGYNVEIINWDNSDFDWSIPKLCVFRTIWDYFHRFGEFSNWMNETSKVTHFLNPVETINWNIDKHYLKELQEKDIPVVPSYFVEKGDQRSLTEIINHLGWQEFILKPCVSGAARHTYAINQGQVGTYDKIFSELIATESMMLQPFMHQIKTKGEVSHIVFGGKYSHSVLKIAKDGDFRVQDDFGGSVHDYVADQKEIDFAEKAVRACHPLPAYARVDVVWDNDDQLAIGELELIEPELWFRKCASAADEFAQVIDQHFKAL